MQYMLLNTPARTLTNILEKYSRKIPKPLNTLFESRVNKEEAVHRYKEKKKKVATKLFPEGRQ